MPKKKQPSSTHTRRSSRDIAWRKYLMLSSTLVNGNRRGINPTASTVSLIKYTIVSKKRKKKKLNGTKKITDHTPTNSISTLIEKARLKAVLCTHPELLSVVYILYAKGTCWLLHTGKRPTCFVVWKVYYVDNNKVNKYSTDLVNPKKNRKEMRKKNLHLVEWVWLTFQQEHERYKHLVRIRKCKSYPHFRLVVVIKVIG